MEILITRQSSRVGRQAAWQSLGENSVFEPPHNRDFAEAAD
jgi:hypothetical protein